MAGRLKRLLERSGILPVLRSQWRDDLRKELTRHGLDAEGRTDASPTSVPERLSDIDREVRILRETIAGDISYRRRAAGYAALLQGPGIADHVHRAIAGAAVETDPSVHIVIDDLLPADTYEAVLDGIPPRVFFSHRDNTKQNLRLSDLRVAPEWTIRTLTFVEEMLVPRMLVPELVRKFAADIREFYIREYGVEVGPALAAIPHQATAGRLMLRRRGYHLEPHLDPKRVVLTCLLYFARPGDSEAFGTSFYRINGTPKIDRTNTFYPASQGLTCDFVKMVPFKPNSAVAFVNWGGAHGADIPKTAPGNTERYWSQFYVSPDPAALAALVGETESAVAE